MENYISVKSVLIIVLQGITKRSGCTDAVFMIKFYLQRDHCFRDRIRAHPASVHCNSWQTECGSIHLVAHWDFYSR